MTQLREKVINRIPTIVQRNIEIRKWSEYSNDLNDLEKSLIEINEKIVDYANRIDKKFGTSMIEIINQEGK